MVVLDGTVVNIALPAAQADLGFSDGDRQWIITAYSLTFASLLLLGAASPISGAASARSSSASSGSPRHPRSPVRRRRSACSSRVVRCRARSARCSPPRRSRCSPPPSRSPRSARGLRRLRRHRGRWRRDRPAARRIPHGPVRLAVEPLHQRVHRARRDHRSRGLRARSPANRSAPEARPPRPRARLGVALPARLRLLERRDRRVGVAAYVGHARGIRRAARRVRAVAAATRTRSCRSRSCEPPAPRPMRWCSLRSRPVRHLPVRHVLPADLARVLAIQVGSVVPADAPPPALAGPAKLSTKPLRAVVAPTKAIVPLGMFFRTVTMVYLMYLHPHTPYAADILPPLMILGFGMGLITPAGLQRPPSASIGRSPASAWPWSTRASRWAARSAPPCSTRSPPPPLLRTTSRADAVTRR